MNTLDTLVKQLQSIGRNKRRYKVFEDFVSISAISLHNAGLPKESYVFKLYEQEYLEIIHTYNKNDQQAMANCFGILVNIMETAGMPQDILGQIYMNMDFGEANQGQFFTPDHVSQLMAQMQMTNLPKLLESQPFISVSEPTCGAGGMLLAVVGEVIKLGYTPHQHLWIQAIDISRIASLMCYVQLSLWHVPAQVMVGNSLTMEMSEILYTPAHRLYMWDTRLRLAQAEQQAKKFVSEPVEVVKVESNSVIDDKSPLPSVPKIVPVEQLGFEF